MKTYSIAILSNKSKVWITNIGKYLRLEDVDWISLHRYCIRSGDIAYGYYYGK